MVSFDIHFHKGHFNRYKIAAIIPATLLAIYLSYNDYHNSWYYGLTFVVWLLVAYTISLQYQATGFTDLNWEYARYALISGFFFALGTLFFMFNKEGKERSYFYEIIGIILLVLGKSGIIMVELGLVNISQYLVVFSVALLVIGNLIELLNLNTVGRIQLYNFGKLMIIVGWITFAFNVIHNPNEKSVDRLVHQCTGNLLQGVQGGLGVQGVQGVQGIKGVVQI